MSAARTPETGLETRSLRKGRRLEVMECDVTEDGRLVARCSLVRVRPEPLTLPEGAPAPPDEPPPDAPEAFFDAPLFDPDRTFFVGSGIEMRVPDPGRFGAGVAWYRLMIPPTPTHVSSPMARALLIAESTSPGRMKLNCFCPWYAHTPAR